MNRLIIIGNGFDIAHGMPTKYSDFVKWYLIELFSSFETQYFNDDAVQVHKKNITYTDNKYKSSYIVKCLKEDININSLMGEILNNPLEFTSSNERIPYWFDFKYPLLKEICLFYVEKNWVDIENLFYKKLLRLSKLEGIDEERNKAVDLLNKGMDYLKNKLDEYLNTIKLPKFNKEILDIINPRLVTFNNNIEKKYAILNFNYTSTISRYLETINGDTHYHFPISNIHIHGQINNKIQPLIFGFGDEMDDHYKILEKTNYNGFLDNMKSFGYFRTDNYQQIANFIELHEAYEVYIMGHSCGLSDRVMLNMIFEHHYCKSIKIFYHGDKHSNNYKVLTQEISRHFNKKNDMRLKIVPFEDCIPFPQSC